MEDFGFNEGMLGHCVPRSCRLLEIMQVKNVRRL
ncbi:hypothetical protein T01_16280 [Trichinella spiralis]|uniref:Uncharacterized protein n=1 Tax=Trichinella spiralis TaxID=6334 RepID=A0A0V1AJJ0_TRISP|nr:hypothetical protein T01_16280 [Trichinella spiralis]